MRQNVRPKDSETQATEERERKVFEKWFFANLEVLGAQPYERSIPRALNDDEWETLRISWQTWQARASEGDGELVKVLREALLKALEWSANFPLGRCDGIPSEADRIAANDVYVAARDALKAALARTQNGVREG